MEVAAIDLVTLDHLGSDVESHAKRSLQLLRAIEETISTLCYERKIFESLASVAHDAAGRVRKAPRVQPIDPEGAVEDKLSEAQATTKELYEAMIEKRKHAEGDPNLTVEDGVVEEYTRSISVVADLHNGVNELRWAIGEYDADLEGPSSRNIQSATELSKALDSL